jgi:D-threo-aldose 1-dehydrogenase
MIATRSIGGLAVPELGFGAAPLGNLYRTVSDADAAAALAAALAAGMRHVDTAPYYGFGLSERRVGEAVRGQEAVVSTKVGRLLRAIDAPGDGERHGFRSPMPFEPEYDYTRDGVLRSHEASLMRLGLERIDILYVHDIGRQVHGDAHERRMAELTTGGGFAALRRLCEEGAIRAFGIGVNEVAVCLEVMDHTPLDAILLAGRYTLLEQEALETLMPRCVAEGTALVIGGPYNSGVLVDGAHYDYAPAPPGVLDRVGRIKAVCARHGVPIGAAALQFVLAHPAVASVIPGLASASEVAATLAYYRTPIPNDLWTELQEEDLLRSDAPIPQAVTCG